jgi:hypothetical protein
MFKDVKTVCQTDRIGKPRKFWLFLVLQLHLQRGTVLQKWDQNNKESKTLANSLTCNVRVQYFEVKFEEADSKYSAKEKSLNLLTGCGSKQGSILFHCQCSDLAM